MNLLAWLATAASVSTVALCALPVIADVASLARRGAPPRLRTGWRESRFLFLVPAHDEAEGIRDCVRSIAEMRYPRGQVRIVVIADNCTDDTAGAARAAGAECLVRHDPQLRGKPYAVAWALARLLLDSVDAVVILDADAIVDPGYAEALDAAGPLRDKAIECYDDVRNPGDSALTRMAAVLAAGRFRGSFQLKMDAGITVPLSDGMCVGTGVLRRHPWSAFGLSEDWEYYALLTAAGERIELASTARLYAQETRTLAQSGSQRQRWLAGKLAALWRVGPRILRSRSITWHQKIDTIAELAVPGPAVQLGVVALCLAAVALANPPASSALVAGLLLTLARPVAYAIIGVRAVPDPARTLAAFTFLPVYTCWRLGVAVASILPARHRPWIRTARG